MLIYIGTQKISFSFVIKLYLSQITKDIAIVYSTNYKGNFHINFAYFAFKMEHNPKKVYRVYKLNKKK